MFNINGTDYTIIVIGIIGAMLFFSIQLILCFKVKRMAVRLIPAYIILLCLLIMAADIAGMFDDGSGFISIKGIFAMVLAIPVGSSLVGDVIAWVVYAFRKRKVKLHIKRLLH